MKEGRVLLSTPIHLPPRGGTGGRHGPRARCGRCLCSPTCTCSGDPPWDQPFTTILEFLTNGCGVTTTVTARSSPGRLEEGCRHPYCRRAIMRCLYTAQCLHLVPLHCSTFSRDATALLRSRLPSSSSSAQHPHQKCDVLPISTSTSSSTVQLTCTVESALSSLSLATL